MGTCAKPAHHPRVHQPLRAVELKERFATQEHFIDLDRMLDAPTNRSGPDRDCLCCERGAAEMAGVDDWSDIWKHGHI